MTAHVDLKPGATISRILPAGIRILAAIDNAARLLGLALLITSGSEDRGRDPSDPHMTGEAFDVSVAGLDAHDIKSLYTYLRSDLGVDFTVLYEVPTLPADTANGLRAIAYVNANATAPHVHIQRRKGTTWPPAEAPTGARRA